MARSQKVSYEGAKLHKRIPARKARVTDVLCNWEINSQIIQKRYVCVIILGLSGRHRGIASLVSG